MSDDLQWKENHPTTPMRSGNGEGSSSPSPSPSPLQNSTRNHSNLTVSSHAKNIPPLPISPQMLKSTISKPINSTSPRQVGKLSFPAYLEVGDVEIQLKKIIDSQASLKSTISLINNAVKQTQMDLGSLIHRSTNNNSRLKDLLENVTTAANNTTGLSEEIVQNIITRALENFKITQYNDIKLTQIEESINSKLSSISDEHNANNEQVISSLSKNLDSHKAYASKNFIEEGFSNVNALSQSLHQAVQSLESELKLEVRRITEKLEDPKQDGLHEHILKKLETSTTGNLDIADKVDNLTGKLEGISEKSIGSNDNLTKVIADLKDKVKNHIESVKTFIERDQISQKVGDISEKLDHQENTITIEIDKLSKLLIESLSIIKELESNKDSLTDSLQKFQTQLDEQGSFLRDNLIDSALTNKDLELQVKDKEIAELKKRLEDQTKISHTSESIEELLKKRTALEIKMDSLEKSYLKRYEDFRLLASEHQLLNDKINQTNIEKLKSIYASATLFNKNFEKQQDSYKNSGTRVLSTNSYLNRERLPGSIKTKKTYVLTENNLKEDVGDQDTSF